MPSRLALAAVVLASSLTLAAPKAPPSFIKPYPGQKPYGDPIEREFDEIYVPAAKVNDEPPSAGWKKLEGKVQQLHFDIPDGRSTLEIFKNYEQALTAAGFEKVYTCVDTGCGNWGGSLNRPPSNWDGALTQWRNHEGRYVLAKLARPEGSVWVAVYVDPIGLPLTKVIVVEEKAMETGLVTIDAAALKKGLEDFGYIAVYGIEFDTGKATLKPSSAPAFAEVKKLLDGSPSLKLYVVGHTDDVGSESNNLSLSAARAQAVMKELVSRHGIAANRLKSFGAGPYVPVASNRSEQGRAKNRRVVLVEDVP